MGEIRRAGRKGTTMGVMMLVDHFKQFNDTFGGHAGGDALCSTSRR